MKREYRAFGKGVAAVAAIALIGVFFVWGELPGKTGGHAGDLAKLPNFSPRSIGETRMPTQAVGKVEHTGLADFAEKVLRSEVPVLVDFYADWCGPCRALAPVLEELARELPQARIVKVNVDQAPDLAAQYGVSAIPTLLVFKNGSVVNEHMGLASKASLKSWLTR